MTAQVIDLDSRRKIWRVAQGYCLACHAFGVRTQPQAAPLKNAECHVCGAYAFETTRWALMEEPS